MFWPEEYRKPNSGYTILLNIVSIPSRYAYSIPCKTKSEGEMRDAFALFLKEAAAKKQDVVRVETDSGSEFDNKLVQALFSEHGVEHTKVLSGDKKKMSIVERYNGTIRGWVARYLSTQKGLRWIDVMDEIQEYYNTRKHRTMKVAPADVTPAIEAQVRSRLEANSAGLRQRVNDIRPGQKVRTLETKTFFQKGKLRWSDNVKELGERVDGTNTWNLKGGGAPVKYSNLQRVGAGSRNIDPKSEETVTHVKQVQHGRRMGRTGLARGTREGISLVQQVESMPAVADGPRKSLRANKAARERLDL